MGNEFLDQLMHIIYVEIRLFFAIMKHVCVLRVLCRIIPLGTIYLRTHDGVIMNFDKIRHASYLRMKLIPFSD